MFSFGWRRISIVYSNDTAGQALFAGALKQAPYFSMRVDASMAMVAALSNAPDGIVWTEENVIKPILAVNTRVVLLLLADTSYYVPFLKAAFRQNIGARHFARRSKP